MKLTTWKQIAAFLGRDERTVKRWEETRGLPVRRLPGNGRASVFAYAHELQAWQDSAAVEATPSPVEVDLTPLSNGDAVQPSGPIRKYAGPALLLVAVMAALGLFILLRGPAASIGQRPSTRDAIAADDYQSGWHEWQTRTPSGLARAITDFHAAIRRDPKFAEAYAGLANTYNLMPEYTGMAADRAYASAHAAAIQAIQLNPSLASAHAALAFTAFYWQRDTTTAQREFARAIALDPGNASAHHWYATFLMTTGDFRAALREIARASQLDPESSAVLADKGLILFYAGQPRQAVSLLRQIETDQPLFASSHRYLATIAAARGDDGTYLRELEAEGEALHDGSAVAVAKAGKAGLAGSGHAGMLRNMLQQRLALYRTGQQSAYTVAENYAVLGDGKDALAYLGISLSRHEPDIIAMKIDPMMAPLRGAPQFRALLSQSGLGGTPQG